MLSAYSSEYFQTDASDVWELFFEMHLILDIQTKFTLCKSFIAKICDEIKIKMEASSPI